MIFYLFYVFSRIFKKLYVYITSLVFHITTKESHQNGFGIEFP